MKHFCAYLILLVMILSACRSPGTTQPTSFEPLSSASIPASSPQPSGIFTQIRTSLDTPVIVTKSPTFTPPEPPVTQPDSATTPAPSPSPLSTDIPKLPPSASAANIIFDSWSPDSQWLAYWASSTQDVENTVYYFIPGNPGFINVIAGESCILDQVVRQGNGDHVEWLDNEEALILIGDSAYRGMPCQKDEFEKTTHSHPSVTSVRKDPLISPDQLYRVVDQVLEPENGFCKYATSIIRRADGAAMVVAEWRMEPRIDGCGSSAMWISKTQYLIGETLDQGPLILDINFGVVNVLKDLFQLKEIPTLLDPQEYALQASALPGYEPDTYHLLVSGVGVEGNFSRVWLYHAESKLVEALPYKYIWESGFSKDGSWLLMDERPIVGGYERRDLWARQLEGVGDEWQVIVPMVDNITWSDSGTEFIASYEYLIRWGEFPGANVIGMWNTLDYWTYNAYFSPDTKKAVVIGNIPGGAISNDTYGLFIVNR